MKNRGTKDNRQRNPAVAISPTFGQTARSQGWLHRPSNVLTNCQKNNGERSVYSDTESDDAGSGGSRMDSAIKYNEDKLRHQRRPDESQLGQVPTFTLVASPACCCIWSLLFVASGQLQ
jgi:hypothetical protein